MECNKSEFQPNYFYLDHISSFMYDELIGLTEVFNNQVSALNKVVVDNLQNEAKVGFTAYWREMFSY